MNPKELWKWTARDFYSQQLYLSHKSNVAAEYAKLIMKKK